MQNEERASNYNLEENLRIHSNRALVVSIIVMATAVLFGSYRIYTLIQAGENYLNLPFVWLLLIVGGISGYLSRKKRPNAAGYTLLGTLTILSLALVLGFEDAFTTLSGAIFAVALAISAVVLTSRNLPRNIVMILVALGLIYFDQFGLPNRTVTPASLTQIFNVMSIISISLLILYLLFSFKNYPIRAKILIATLGVALISILIISTSLFLFNRSRLIEEGSQNVQQVAKSESIAFGELILQQIRIVETASLNPALSELAIEQNNSYGDNSVEIIIAQIEAIDRIWRVVSENNDFVSPRLTNEQADNLRLLREAFPGNVEVFATDKYGGIIASTNKTTDYYQADEAWWLEAYNEGEGAVYIGDPEFDSSADSFAVNIAVPIIDQSNNMFADAEVVGVLRTTFRLDRLNDILEATNVIDEVSNVNIYVNDEISIVFKEDGQVVIEVPDQSTLNIVQNFEESSVDIQILELDGNRYFATVAQVNTHENASSILDLNWLVVVRQLESDVLAAVRQQTQTVTILSIGAVLISAIASIFVGNLIVSPITQLTSVAQRIEGGDRLARAEIPETEDEIKNLSLALNSMTNELNIILNELELRVANRTRSLEIASNVSRELSSILDLDQLLASVVNLIRDTYDYYHVQIYLWNEDKTKLIMRQGTGNAGAELLSEAFYISPDRGLVGQAATSSQPVFIPNVRDVNRPIAWVPNAKLPKTVSEIVVPITLQNEVVGVLDVQEAELGKMTQDDLNTLQVVANQIGIAIQNARAYEEIQKRAIQDQLLLTINHKILQTDSFDALEKTAVSELEQHVDGNLSVDFSFLQQNSDLIGNPVYAENSKEQEGFIGHIQVSGSLRDDEKSLVTAVSEQIEDHAKILYLNNSIEKAYRETAQYSEQLKQLNDLNTESNALTSADKVFRLVTSRVLEITGMMRSSITLIDENDPTQLILINQEGLTEELGVGQNMDLKNSPMEKAIYSGRVEEGVFGSDENQLTARFIPIIALGKVIGTLNVAHSDPTVFSVQNAQLLNQIAISTSSILESKMLFEQNQDSLLETESLYEIVSQLNKAVTIPDVLKAITESPIAKGFYHASISLIESDATNQPLWLEMNEVIISNEVTNEPFERGARFYIPDMKMVNLWVNRPSEVVIVQNVQTDPNVDKEVRENLKKIGNKTMVFIPLHIRGRWLGLVRLAWNIEKTFSKLDTRLRNVVSEQASIVTNQIILFSEARKRATQLEELTKIEGLLSQAINENDILRSIERAVDKPKSITLFHLRNDEFRNPVAFQQVAHLKDGAFHGPADYAIPLTETHPIFNEWQSNPNQIVTVENIDEYPRMDNEARQSYQSVALKSLIVIPLINFGRWQGVLEIGWNKIRQFNNDELSLLQQLIEPVAANVASKRALAETDKLYQVSEKLNNAQSYKDVLNIFDEYSPLSKKADVRQIIYFNQPYVDDDLPDWFEIVEQIKNDESYEVPFEPTRHNLSEFLQLEKLSKYEPFIIEDTTKNQQFHKVAQPALLASIEAKSTISFPLNLANMQLGFVNYYFKEKTIFYGFEVRELIRLIEQAAIAIQGVRYLKLAQSRVIREQKIREIAARVRSSTNVESILRTAAKEVGNALGRHSVVYLETNGTKSNE